MHEVELVGILLGIQLISTERHGSMPFMLGIDNEAAIKAFQSDLRSLPVGHHIVREILQVTNHVKNLRKKIRYTLNIQ